MGSETMVNSVKVELRGDQSGENLLYIFDKTMDEMVRKYLVQGSGYERDYIGYEKSLLSVLPMIGAMLLQFDGIAMKVYGENIALAVLIKAFGIGGLEALLEEDAIRFVLWTSFLTYNVTDAVGIYPLQHGGVTSLAHCDPEKSATLGLNWARDTVPRRVRRMLVRKVRDKYFTVPKDCASDAVTFGHEGYQTDTFSEFGLPFTVDLDVLDLKSRQHLASLADEAMELFLLGALKLNAVGSPRLTKLQGVEIRRLTQAKKLVGVSHKICEIENMLDFETIIKVLLGKHPNDALKWLPKLRASKGGRSYRKWVKGINANTDLAEVSRLYLDAIETRGLLFDRKVPKALKTGALVLVSSLAGITLPLESSLAVGAGLTLLDKYILDSIEDRTAPRTFFNDFRQIADG